MPPWFSDFHIPTDSAGSLLFPLISRSVIIRKVAGVSGRGYLLLVRHQLPDLLERPVQAAFRNMTNGGVDQFACGRGGHVQLGEEAQRLSCAAALETC